MTFSDETYNLRIELDTKNCECTPDEIAKMEAALDPLSKVVKDFPVRDLYITIAYHPNSAHFDVRTSLVLPGKTLATGDHDDHAYPAYERCIRKLVHSVSSYKDRLGNNAEQSKIEKGTLHDVLPTQIPEFEKVQQAVQDGDYAAFRRGTSVYEEPLRKRVGRWVQRFPDIEAQIGDKFKIDDIVEEVFLNAFDSFDHRPHDVPFHDWLENLVAPSLKTLVRHPDEELENINMARTMRDAEQ